MKKLLAIFTVLVLALTLAACTECEECETCETCETCQTCDTCEVCEEDLPAVVDMSNIDDYLAREDAQYVDLRNWQDKMKSGYVSGFEFIPFFQYLEGTALVRNTGWDFTSADLIDQATLENFFDKDAEVIFLMCGSGTRAGYVKAALESIGYTNVVNAGGFSSYSGDNKVFGDGEYSYTVVKGDYTPGTYFASNDHHYQVTMVVDPNGVITGVFFDAATAVSDVLCTQDDVDAGTLDAAGNACVLDAVKVEGYATTKQQLGDAYGGGFWSGTYRWYEQVDMLAAKVVAEQGYDWAVYYADQTAMDDAGFGKTWTEDRDWLDQSIDGVAGVTIHVEGLAEVLMDVLAQASGQ